MQSAITLVFQKLVLGSNVAPSLTQQQLQRPLDAVCFVQCGNSTASGFLVLWQRRYCIATNSHVIESKEQAAHLGTRVIFNKDTDQETVLALDPDAFFWSLPRDRLDVTIVAIDQTDRLGERRLAAAYDLYEHVRRDEIVLQQQVEIYAHPAGIALRYSAGRLLSMFGHVKGVSVSHNASTVDGSSGGLVLTSDGKRLLAIHAARDAKLPCNYGVLIADAVAAMRGAPDERFGEDNPPNPPPITIEDESDGFPAATASVIAGGGLALKLFSVFTAVSELPALYLGGVSLGTVVPAQGALISSALLAGGASLCISIPAGAIAFGVVYGGLRALKSWRR
jgi:hypothetical protein